MFRDRLDTVIDRHPQLAQPAVKDLFSNQVDRGDKVPSLALVATGTEGYRWLTLAAAGSIRTRPSSGRVGLQT